VANQYGGVIILLRVDEPDFQMVFDEVIDRGIGNGKRHIPNLGTQLYLACIEESFRKKEIKTKVVTECGDVVSTIIRVASRENTDLIAMSCREATGIQNSINNSVIYQLLLQADCPLFITQAQGEIAEIDSNQRGPTRMIVSEKESNGQSVFRYCVQGK
jgi:nucleotide-binding universal stress UspA family protein